MKEENFENPVKLIRFDVSQDSHPPEDDIAQMRSVYAEFDNNPLAMLRTSMEPLPNNVDVIVGHSSVSSSAALRLRDRMYPNSKVCKLPPAKRCDIISGICSYVCPSVCL